MEGAAQMTPVVENPRCVQRLKHKRDGCVERVSHRLKGKEPFILEAVPKKQEVKNLVVKGGRAGRIFEERTVWNFPEFETSDVWLEDFLPNKERANKKKSCFQNIISIENDFRMEEDDETNEESIATHHIVNLQKLEKPINFLMICSCSVDEQIQNFIDFCVNNDPAVHSHQMKRLFERWKENCEDKKGDKKKENKVEIQSKQYGMISKTHLICNYCKKIQPVDTKEVLGTLASGIGPSDMENLMIFMDVPVPKSFLYGTFTKLENLIRVSLRKIAGEAMKGGLEEEIQIEAGMPYKEWLKTNNKVKLTCSYDMGWNKRSSGNRYGSLSGHGFLIGCKCRKIVKAQVISKKCNICAKASAKGEDPQPHDYTGNYQASSKADRALEILKCIYKENNGRVAVGTIVADDDSTMRALCRHKTIHYKKGKLSDEIPEPTWSADPSHRTKVASRAIYALAGSRDRASTCTQTDAIRFQKQFGYMLKLSRNKTLKYILNSCKAVIEYDEISHHHGDI